MPDSFRQLDTLTEPDPRWASFRVFDPGIRGLRPMTIEDIHRQLGGLDLRETVPDQVRCHFDRTRNLALYSWFVYAFIPVADWHACATLELALKIKTGCKRCGLRKLIERAIREQWVRNEGFSRWRQQRESFEQHLLSQRHICTDIGIPFDPPNAGTFQWDYVSMLLKSLPVLRNEYAHGSAMLYPGALNLGIVAEFINQLFIEDEPPSDDAPDEPHAENT